MNRVDILKVEFTDDNTGESEWLWVVVDRCDDEQRIVYGRLDNAPIAVFLDKLRLGQELAISYDLVRDMWKETNDVTEQGGSDCQPVLRFPGRLPLASEVAFLGPPAYLTHLRVLHLARIV